MGTFSSTMMEDGRGPSPGSIFGTYPSYGQGGSGGLTGLSPYLNVDPSYLQTGAPEFIRNEETKRGNLENSFTAIGSSVLIGGAIGGSYGIYDGVRETALKQMKGKLRRTQILNHSLKSGGSVSNALGSIAVVYSSLYILMNQIYEEEDEAKTCVTGAVTGLLYKSSSGIKSCAKGGLFGLTAAALWAFLLKKDQRISDYM